MGWKTILGRKFKKSIIMSKVIKFIDLFAGLGGTRIGFELACKKLSLKSSCVFTSEIKQSAIEVYSDNFKDNIIHGDITKINENDIPDFDFMLAGFPCQPFSSAGKRRGFFDTRGTLFFNIEKILKTKKPRGFLLENVEGLVTHGKGKTLEVIINNLKNLGYEVHYEVLDSSHYGVPQKRKRTYIVGHHNKKITFDKLKKKTKLIEEILEKGVASEETAFTKKLLEKFKPEELYGKAIKDKRGGSQNIHSWDIELKGIVNKNQKWILEKILRERRKKHWAEKKGIKWMDGMPLTINEIKTFTDNLFLSNVNLEEELNDLVTKKYLTFEHPKKQIQRKVSNGYVYERVPDETVPKGYNIVAGKLSFEISKILDPKDVAPTIVATDASKLAVIDSGKIRRLTIREGLRLFGFPETYKIKQPFNKAYDLLGNSVVVPVIKIVSERLLK